MKIFSFENKVRAGEAAAGSIATVVLEKPNATLGLATGSSPIETYKALAEMCREGDVSFAFTDSINLDEYVGLSGEHEQSYARFMRENLFDHIDIDLGRTNIPNGLAENPEEECRRYDALLESIGYADVQLLGIGHNGHIGFNEPADELIRGTHLTALTPDTIEANARFFASEDDVPKHALTMGIQSVFKARKILLLANGKNKAEAIKAMIQGNVTTSCPATLLCLHPDVTVICDEDAYSLV